MLNISEADLLDDDHPYSSLFHASSFHSYTMVPQEVTELTVDACSLEHLKQPILTKMCSENMSVKNEQNSHFNFFFFWGGGGSYNCK